MNEDEEGYQWYPSFDQLGELLKRPNPTEALDWLMRVLRHIVDECGYQADKIHLFGFAQGGSVAAELALKWWRAQSQEDNRTALGSIVSISGPLLSYPTIAPNARCPTPCLVCRGSGESADEVTALKKGYSQVEETRMAGAGMPRTRDGWRPIMAFWAGVLSRQAPCGEVYEVMR